MIYPIKLQEEWPRLLGMLRGTYSGLTPSKLNVKE